MRHTVDARFLREAHTFKLRFTCEHCAHFMEATRTCGEGYPNHEHLEKPLQDGAEMVFCKSFELV